MNEPNGDGFQPTDTEKDSAMNRTRELMHPAVIAALLLFAGSAGTAPAMADDRGSIETSEMSSAQIEEASKEHAALANEAAVEEAAQAIKEATRLDLDIRLIGRTSVIIAGDV
jgi:outer membrane murein-binding lipoprotein Lpp